MPLTLRSSSAPGRVSSEQLPSLWPEFHPPPPSHLQKMQSSPEKEPRLGGGRGVGEAAEDDWIPSVRSWAAAKAAAGHGLRPAPARRPPLQPTAPGPVPLLALLKRKLDQQFFFFFLNSLKRAKIQKSFRKELSN